MQPICNLNPLRVLALFLAAFSAAAQTPANAVKGRVFDSSNMPIAEAYVTLVSAGDAPQQSFTTGPDGVFSFLARPGSYTVRVAKEGFLDGVRQVLLGETSDISVDIKLQIAPVRDTVTVTENTAYLSGMTSSGTKTLTLLRDIPQSISVVTREQIHDQMMMSIGDVVRYVPGVTAIQGENNRDQVVIRGNSSSADFFVDGVRDDVQYYRDLYSLERVEVLKGPNAMIFGRGGGGGVINRVTKTADFMRLGEITLQGGSYSNKRIAGDFDRPLLNNKLAARVNGMYENSGSFRKYVGLERFGVSPTLTFTPSTRTTLRMGYEHFRDIRAADRGIPSFQGRPADIDIATFFGDPDRSQVRARVNLGRFAAERQLGRWMLRNQTLVGDYDRYYQNYVPGAVTPDQTQVALSTYNNATQRRNLFNQTDVTSTLRSGWIRHTILVGAEAGRQLTDNLRTTGFFNNTAASLLAPYSDPVIHTPVTFRPNATDANNHLRVNIGATYIQDQVELSRYVQLVGGVRFDHFDLQYHNNRNNDNLRRIDNLVSPRAGIVFKPMALMSVYGSYSVSYLPSSGDQFASLTSITQQVKPEKFENYELGIKWDLRRDLSLTTAVYRLDRTNTRATDPNDPTRIIQTGSQRTNGYELGLTGGLTRKWKGSGGYAYQDAFVTSATTAARAGAQAGQVPRHTFSAWNFYQIRPRLGAGLGVLRRADMFAAIDNTVTLPAYTRADAAVYYSFTENIRLQANVENLWNTRYYLNADSNTNITPGSPRAVRVGLTVRF